MMSLSSVLVLYDLDLTFSWLRWLLPLMVLVLFLVYQMKKSAITDTSTYPLPPGPFAWPVIGNLVSLGRTPHKALTVLRKQYGNIFKIQLGSRPTVVLNGMAVIRQACVKQSEEFAGRPDFYTFKFLANGKSMGFSDYGPRWKLHRKIAQNVLAMFVNDRDNPMEQAIQEEAKTLVSNLLQSNSPLDPHDEIYLSVGNIICALCFGKRYQRDDTDFKLLVKMNAEFMAYAGAGNPVDIMPWMRHFTKRSFNSFLAILKTMDQFCLKKRKEHLDTFDATRIRDVTDALIRCAEELDDDIKDRVGLTDEHILLTVQELIGAGFDTISTTLQWSLLFMATHPEVQEKVKVEIDEVIGKRLPTVVDSKKLIYTEAVILEIMRHSCIFPLALPHSTTKDTFFEGFHIPDKTLIFINLWSVTRDSEVFPSPEVFDPARFLDESQKNLRRDAMECFLPFGAGRRRCPGEQLGRMEIFLFFVIMMQNLTVEKVPGFKYTLEPKNGLTLKPQNFKVKITERVRPQHL